MKYLFFKKASVIFLFTCGMTLMNAAAQSDDRASRAYDLYQTGMKSLETQDYDVAIKNLKEAVALYGDITDLEGVETVKESAEQALSQTYYAYGMGLYQDKNFDQAIEQFKNAEIFSITIANHEIATKASNYIGRVYVSKASAAFNEKKYDETIVAADEALKIDNEDEMAYFWRGRAYKEQGDLAKMKVDLDHCMELIKGDEQKVKTYSNAARVAGAAYMSAGVESIKSKKYSDAVEHLKTAVSYPEINANAYYYLAVSYNALSKWNDAVSAANTALTMELKDPSATYLELGKAYEGAGKATDACNAYKKVTTEQYKKVADYQIKNVLKCN